MIDDLTDLKSYQKGSIYNFQEREIDMPHIDDPQTQKANMDFIRNSMNEPMLEKDHERELVQKWIEDKDEKALHEIIRSHTRLAVSIASGV